MIKFIVLIFLISINFAHGKCGKWIYALPGDTYWPSEEAFLSLRANIIGNVIIKGDKNFTPHTWSTLNNVPRPAVIVQPKELNDIIVALKFARHYNIRVSVQSTGHQMDRRNIYDNSVLVDMSTMNSLSYNSAKKTLTTGPGNTFANIQKYLASITNKTYVALCGADPSVGIYGWSVGGGHGALTRLYGLGVDALLSIDLILANFTIITANSTHNAALYRALRGSGGGAYGIAVSLTIQLYPDPGVMSIFTGIFPLSTATSNMFATWIESAPYLAGGYYVAVNIDFSKYVSISAHCFSNSTYCSAVLSLVQTGCISSCSLVLDAFLHFHDYILR